MQECACGRHHPPSQRKGETKGPQRLFVLKSSLQPLKTESWSNVKGQSTTAQSLNTMHQIRKKIAYNSGIINKLPIAETSMKCIGDRVQNIWYLWPFTNQTKTISPPSSKFFARVPAIILTKVQAAVGYSSKGLFLKEWGSASDCGMIHVSSNYTSRCHTGHRQH